MLHGDEVWCQLFSEPAAGLGPRRRCRRAPARRTTARWVLNGQKVWTTNAQFAAYGLLLARTDPELPKHKGLTMFIVPMDAEGVTSAACARSPARPSSTRSSSTTCKLDADAVVGQVNDGWGTALTTLMFERVTIGLGSEGMGYTRGPLRRGDRRPTPTRARDPDVRKRLGEIATELLAHQVHRLPDADRAAARARSPAPRPAWRRSRRSTRRSPPAT